jgi:lipopolysaccharide heptosyltransferase III
MINFLCRYYKASEPCKFNKIDGSECPTCVHASEFRDRILFIKLDAIGDVLRSASLLPSIVSRHNSPYLAWLTRKESVELVGLLRYVDEVIELSEVGLARVMTGGWDYVYSLSNDWPSASIASAAQSKTSPIGYYVRDGMLTPSNSAAARWLEMAAFDRLKKCNTKTYQAIMFSIVGFDCAEIPAPSLELTHDQKRAATARIATLFGPSTRRRVAINVGSDGRWPKKMLDVDQIYNYIQHLRKRIDVDVLLVGGAAEREKAFAIGRLCNVDHRVSIAITETSIVEFIAILTEVDVLLCGDTLALHVATAIGLPTVAVFGPTSSSESADFNGLVKKIWTDSLDCLVCYGDCAKERNCMSLIDAGSLVDLTEIQLSHRLRRTAKETTIE